MISFHASLAKKSYVTQKALSLVFTLDGDVPLCFVPGQYVWLILPDLQVDDSQDNRRAFSIVSPSSDQKNIELLIVLSDSEYKQACIHMEVGAKVEILGPFGSSFTITDQEKCQRVVIAGGCGIASFLSILRSPLSLPSELFQVITVNSSDSDACYQEELVKLAQEKNISFESKFGHFTEGMLPDSINYSDAEFYICGSQGFVDVVHKALVDRGVAHEQFHFEQYYPSPAHNLTEDFFSSSMGTSNILLQALQDSRNHVIITDLNGKIVFANKMAEKFTGFTFAQMRGNTPRLWGGLMSPAFYADFWQRKARHEGFDGELTNRRKNGEEYHSIAHISPIFDVKGNAIGYIGTEEDITERVKLEKAKSEFVSIASHQLRTPLGIVKWYLEALQGNDYVKQAPPKVSEYINQIHKSNERILALVRDLLSVSRIDQARVKDIPQEVDVTTLVEEIVREMSILAEKQNITFELQKKSTAVPAITLDPIRLREVIANLISNAFEFTPNGGRVSVILDATADSIVVSVSDTGIGIAEEDQQKLFQKFVRLEKAVSVNPNGTGLGLYVVKSYIDAWGGSVKISSKLGEGATFTISVPIQQKTEGTV